MLVELAGLPGSGKTTVTRLLQQKLQENGIVVLGAEEIAVDINRQKRVPRYLRARPDRALLHRFIRFQRRHPELDALAQNAFKQAPIRHLLFAMMAASHQGVSDTGSSNEVAMMDEGFISHAVSTFFDAANPDDFTRFLELTPASDLVVSLDLPPDTAFSRVVARNEDVQNDGDSENRAIRKFGDRAAFARRHKMFLEANSIYLARGMDVLIFDTDTMSAEYIAEQVFKAISAKQAEMSASA